jgi:hypothetical protein
LAVNSGLPGSQEREAVAAMGAASINAALLAYREAGVEAPGLALATAWGPLLREPAQNSNLSAQLLTLAESLPVNAAERLDLYAARAALTDAPQESRAA